jgi:hypothetical protein
VSSILTSIKKALGLVESYEAFDPDIVMYTNTVFSTLNQLGVGPELGFQISDKTATWESFLGSDPRLNFVQSYVYLKVRLLFDPPATSFAIAAFEKQIEELGWRISVFREGEKWVSPAIPT